MKNLKFIDGKVSDTDNRGYIMYRKYEDGVFVLMGSYTDTEHRGKGVWKTLFEKFMVEDVKTGDTVEAAACSKVLTKYMLNNGFEKIDEPVRYWGNISNGVNLKIVKK
jgi:predicted GNAT family acetyltransferase